MKHVSLFTIIASLFLSEPVLLSEIRKKRVLYGHEGHEGDRDAYDSFRYYVFLASKEPSWIWYPLIRGDPNPQDLVCGGSLLTPFIIQTAAHCVGSLGRIEEDDEGNNVTYYQPKNVWENPRYAYVGSNLVTRTGYWLRPKNYIIYQATRQIVRSTLGIMFDFGLVLTRTTIVETAPEAAISYAPAYRSLSIVRFHRSAITQEYTCLYIGHGLWNVLLGVQGLYVDRHSSDFIRWGWRTVMNEHDCEIVTYDQRERRRYNFDYAQYATWVCGQTSRHYPRAYDALYNTGDGDSGGPVTCNNVYFAVISGGIDFDSENIISYDSPIIYTMFENSAELRDRFIGYYSGIVWPNPGELVPSHHPLSRAPPKTHVHYLLVLSMTTFFILLS